MDGHGTPTRVTVIGCGRVGSVTCACLAAIGHRVTGVDINGRLVEHLTQGRAPFVEPGLDELLQQGLTRGALRFTTDLADGLTDSDVVFVCVDTPRGASPKSRERLLSLAEEIATVGGPPYPILVVRSTYPIGTAAALAQEVERTGVALPLAVVPEFLSQGNAVREFLEPARTVIGATRPEVALIMSRLFAPLPGPLLVTTPTEAEAIKHFANAALATRVSFANEVAGVCESLGLDADRVLSAVGLDRRIGSDYLTPGIGFGGSCLPKDLEELIRLAAAQGQEVPLLAAVREVNESQAQRFVDLVEEAAGSLAGVRVGVLGVTFKGGTDDLRESPALKVIDELTARGATVRYFDPGLAGSSGLYFPSTTTPLEAIADAAVAVVLSNWEDFRSIDWTEVASKMRGTLVVDGRMAVEREAVEAAGLRYVGVGRPARDPAHTVPSE